MVFGLSKLCFPFCAPACLNSDAFRAVFLVAVSSLFVAAARYQKLSLHEKRGMTRLRKQLLTRPV